ncbi:MAG: hypothetical protein HRT89_01495 [Lentisphaeria bacterium]|nr:hypothetical protein [Lentisphaeria bacterium]NQZ66720.1 hypothetical protein [Lentisphaeria bacterium]
MRLILLLITSVFIYAAESKDKNSLAKYDKTEIVDLRLNPKMVFTLPIRSMDLGLTTIMFPGPIEGIYSSKVESMQGQEKIFNPFVMSHEKGSYFFLVKSLAPEGKRAAVNVIFERQTYVIKLVSAKKAVSAVNFLRPVVLKERKAMPPRLILGLIDKSKAYSLFKEHQPEQLAGSSHKVFKNLAFKYRFHDIKLIEAFRYTAQDTIIFHCEIKNKTTAILRLNPKNYIANIKGKFYHSALSESPDTIGPKSSVRIYFAIVGKSSGGRNNLSLDNNWTIVAPIDEKRAAKQLGLDLKAPKESK